MENTGHDFVKAKKKVLNPFKLVVSIFSRKLEKNND